jgi:hypothetical protein
MTAATQLPRWLLIRFLLKCIAGAAKMIFPQVAGLTFTGSTYE